MIRAYGVPSPATKAGPRGSSAKVQRFRTVAIGQRFACCWRMMHRKSKFKGWKLCADSPLYVGGLFGLQLCGPTNP